MYAGLASAMMALVFLYLTAAIFIYGGELNSAIYGRAGRMAMRAAPSRTTAARRLQHVSSKLRRPVRGALTSTAMLPGGCWFFHIFVCA